jgi:hemerythrin superfamily protein
MICTWLAEIMLHQINSEEESMRSFKAVLDRKQEDNSDFYKSAYQKHSSNFTAAVNEFRNFLTKYKDRLHVGTLYKLINTHNRMEEYIFFANEIQDWEVLLDYYLFNRDWVKALDSLSRHSIMDLYYKSSTILIENAPTETVNLWMKQSQLNPKNLIPSLIRYNMLHSKNVHEKVRWSRLLMIRMMR